MCTDINNDVLPDISIQHHVNWLRKKRLWFSKLWNNNPGLAIVYGIEIMYFNGSTVPTIFLFEMSDRMPMFFMSSKPQKCFPARPIKDFCPQSRELSWDMSLPTFCFLCCIQSQARSIFLSFNTDIVIFEMLCTMRFLLDTWNCGLRMRRECGECFVATEFKGNRELAIPTCMTARPWRTCRD